MHRRCGSIASIQTALKLFSRDARSVADGHNKAFGSRPSRHRSGKHVAWHFPGAEGSKRKREVRLMEPSRTRGRDLRQSKRNVAEFPGRAKVRQYSFAATWPRVRKGRDFGPLISKIYRDCQFVKRGGKNYFQAATPPPPTHWRPERASNPVYKCNLKSLPLSRPTPDVGRRKEKEGCRGRCTGLEPIPLLPRCDFSVRTLRHRS